MKDLYSAHGKDRMFINSVTGPVDTAALGPTLVHEHVGGADWSLRMNGGSRFFDYDTVVSAAVAAFAKVKQECGITTVVDGTPINMGRDVELVRDVARRTGITFIVSSGFYYQEEPSLANSSVDDIYDFLLTECQHGVGDTGIMPGIMKAAVGTAGVTPYLTKMLTAIARVAATTGLPVFCHHDVNARSGGDILDIFEHEGVPLDRFILGHSGDTDDLSYLEPLLTRGCNIGMDRFAYDDVMLGLQPRVDTIAALWRQGYADQMMLSHDLVAYRGRLVTRDNASRPEPHDLTYIQTTVFPALEKAGVPREDLVHMITDNPRRLFETV